MPGTAKLQKGIHAAQGGNMKRAVEMFRAAIKADPHNADALHFCGRATFQLGKPDQAISLLRRALDVAPEKADAHNDLGLILRRTGNEDDARDCFEAALRRDPIHVQALNNLGAVQRNAGDFEEAIKTLEQAVALAPNFAEAHHNLGNCYAYTEQSTKAMVHYYQSLDKGGDWSNPVRVAKVLVANGNSDDAIRILESYLEKHPDHEPAQYQLAAVRGDALDCANETYVTTHFDNFAESFDAVLERLDYMAPQLVADALAARLGAPQAEKTVLDLGCGTGLCGPLVAPYKSHMTGIDLSKEMLAKAMKHGCYDRLQVAELQSFLLGSPQASFDIALCVDTLVYIGALERTFDGIRHALRSGGLFIATVEQMEQGDPRGHRVDGSGRFKHARHYIEALAVDGLRLVGVSDVVLRKEAGAPVEGFVIEIEKT